MVLFWKPNGSLDVSADATDLPETSNGGNTTSGAIQRMKNIRQDRQGIAQTRYGSVLRYSISNFSGQPELFFIVDGHRYVFTANKIYYDEILVSLEGYKCAAPVFSPEPGNYITKQTVIITSTFTRGRIYYTLDGSIPNRSSMLYTAPIVVPEGAVLSAFVIDPGGYMADSDVVSGYYGVLAQSRMITETELNYLTTDTYGGHITTEGM